jgi:hypothetical protein
MEPGDWQLLIDFNHPLTFIELPGLRFEMNEGLGDEY